MDRQAIIEWADTLKGDYYGGEGLNGKERAALSDLLKPAFDDVALQQACEAHLAACMEALHDEQEGGDAESPAFGPFCGCETCVVREVLMAGYEGLLARAKAAPAQDVTDQVLADIITGAAEGCTGYWAQVSQYQYLDGLELRRCVGERRPDEGTRATLHQLKDDESGYEDEGLELTLDVVRTGIARIMAGEVELPEGMRDRIVQEVLDEDCDLDANDVDTIVQAGLLGSIVY